jgi:hypothetical protein
VGGQISVVVARPSAACGVLWTVSTSSSCAGARCSKEAAEMATGCASGSGVEAAKNAVWGKMERCWSGGRSAVFGCLGICDVVWLGICRRATKLQSGAGGII